jgi:hypothetical protein
MISAKVLSLSDSFAKIITEKGAGGRGVTEKGRQA